MPHATFSVEGFGEFPFDMLRYDSCWPSSSEDAAKMQHHSNRERRQITLQSAGRGAPTRGRWDSFNWRVID